MVRRGMILIPILVLLAGCPKPPENPWYIMDSGTCTRATLHVATGYSTAVSFSLDGERSTYDLCLRDIIPPKVPEVGHRYVIYYDGVDKYSIAEPKTEVDGKPQDPAADTSRSGGVR